MKPALPDAGYWERTKAEFAAEWAAYYAERGEIIKGTGIDPSADRECWVWEKAHPGRTLPAWMADWRIPRQRFENGSHAQSDNATDRQNERDAADAMERVFANYQPSRTAADKPVKRPRKKVSRVHA